MGDTEMGPRLYSCYKCKNHVAQRHFRGLLFSHTMNIFCGPKVDRRMITGLYTAADVCCGDCPQVLGWKYEKAYQEQQKYKEGKFVLEKFKIVKDNW